MYYNQYDDNDDKNYHLDLEPPDKRARSGGNYNDVHDTIKDSKQSVEKCRLATMSKSFKKK